MNRRLALLRSSLVLLMWFAASPASAAAAKTATPCATPCTLACQPFGVRPQDDVWAISTRQIGCCTIAFTPQVWHYELGRWQPSTLAAFYASDSPEQVTSVYLHGNRIDHGYALSNGLDVYFQLVGRFSEERPTRFVIWSWPSSQIKGAIQDARAKAARTDIEGYLLAQFLSGMQSDVQVGLVGYSFGARIVTGGLHLLGGGQLCGRVISGGNRQPIRVVLWAAALHNHWLLPGHCHGQALQMADRWLIYVNNCDPALRRYRALDRYSKPEPLGYTGFAGLNSLPPHLRGRVEQLNVSHIVGTSHDMRAYLNAGTIIHRTRQYALWYDLMGGTPALAAPAAPRPAGKPTPVLATEKREQTLTLKPASGA